MPERKTHIVKGGQNGWAMVARAFDGRLIGGGISAIEHATTVWRVEGLPDLLALASVMPAGHAVITNIAGATGDAKLPMDFLTGKDHVLCIGDTDTAGQAGAERFAKQAARHAADVRVVRLPYDISDDHGHDVRDFLNDEGSVEELLEVADSAEPVQSDTEPGSRPSLDDESCITNAIGTDESPIPIPMASILDSIQEHTGGNLYRIGSLLFTSSEPGKIEYLKRQSDLFGWLASVTDCPPRIYDRPGFCSKPEIFAELKRTAEEYQGVETLPHWPAIDRIYYSCERTEPGDGSHLEALLDRFSPASEYDRDLLKALFVTVFWGGPAGGRPAFAITAPKRGCGKTTIAKVAMRLCGGGIEVRPNEDATAIRKRILSDGGMQKRIVLIDNLKSFRFSNAELEAMVTAAEIDGWILFSGNGSRPNYLTWLVTLNAPSFSNDMAQRTVFIQLAEPEHSGDWEETTMQFVEDHRNQIIGDIAAFLQEEREPLTHYSRWGQWERDILGRLPEPAELQRLVAERQGEVDAEVEETAVIAETFAEQLAKLDYDVPRERVFIPSRIAAEWLGIAMGERITTTKSTNILKQKIGEGKLACLQIPGRTHGRGFLFVGEDVHRDTATAYDLEERRSESKRTSEYRSAIEKVSFGGEAPKNGEF